MFDILQRCGVNVESRQRDSNRNLITAERTDGGEERDEGTVRRHLVPRTRSSRLAAVD